MLNEEHEKESRTHVFLKPCGCLSVALVDDPRNFVELGKAYKYAQKHGETYQVMDTQKVREMKWRCDLHQKEHDAKIAKKGDNKLRSNLL